MQKLVPFLLIACAVWAQGDDRGTAEWALRNGGRVRLAGAPWMVDVQALPAGAFRLDGVDLAGTIVDHKDLKLLSGCTELRELILPGTIFNPGAGSNLDANKELAALKSLTKLEKFSLSLHFLENINVQDKGLKEFANLTQIREMRIAMARVNGTGLASFVNVEKLDLNNTRMNDEGMKQVAGMKKLRYLSLRDTVVTDEGLRQLAELRDLETLDLFGLRLTDRGVSHLRGLTKLKRLNILGSALTDAGVEALEPLKELTELNLYRTQITNAGLSKLKGLKNLTSLDVRYARVTRGGVDDLVAANPRVRVEFQDAAPQTADPALRSAKPTTMTDAAIAGWIEKMGGRSSLEAGKIRSVDLSRTSVSDAQLAYLSGLTAVTRLRLNTTEVGDGGMVHVGKIKTLVDLDLGHSMVSDTGMAALNGLTGLQRLTLNHTLSKGNLPMTMPLEELEISNTTFDDQSAAALAKMPTLRSLRLAYTDVTADGLKALSALPLRKLDILSNDIGDEAMVHIGKMTTLEELYLSYCRHTNKGLADLSGLTNLQVFESVRTRLDDKAVPYLNGFAKLRRLNLDYTGLSDEGLAALLLPELEELRLDTANLTDAAVETLAKFAKLKSVNLYHTLITEAGYNKLKAAKPQLDVVFDRESSIPRRRKS